MVDAVSPHFGSSAGEQLHALCTHTVQLLTMMEVVHMSMAQDAVYLVDATAALETFAQQTAATVPPAMALDPLNRSRDCLQVVLAKAQLLSRSSLHMAKISTADNATVHTLIARSLGRLAGVCERLADAVTKHDLALASAEPAGSPRASA